MAFALYWVLGSVHETREEAGRLRVQPTLLLPRGVWYLPEAHRHRGPWNPASRIFLMAVPAEHTPFLGQLLVSQLKCLRPM